MKKITLSILIFILTYSLKAQIMQQGKITWLLGSGGGDARLSYTLKSTGLIGGTGAYGYTGIESIELLLRNNTSHKLIVKVSYTISNTCNESKLFEKTETLEPNEITASKGPFYTGVDYETTCKTFKKVEDKSTVINNISINLISIEDITEKNTLTKRKSEQIEKEEKYKTEQTRIKNQKNKEPEKQKVAITQKNAEKPANNTTNSSSQENSTATSYQNTKTSVEEQTADDKYNEQLRIYNQSMEAAEEKRKIDAANSTRIGEGVASLAGSIYSGIQADAERKGRKMLSEMALAKENKEKAQLLLKNFLSTAQLGNENAITQVIEAYRLMDYPQKHYDEIRNDGYYATYYPNNYIDFLNSMYKNFNSTNAQKALLAHYNNEVEAFKQVVIDHRRKAIVRPLLGVAIAVGGLLGGQKLEEQESLRNIDNTKNGPVVPPAVVQSVGIIGGGVLFFSGLINLVRIGQANRDPNFINAKSKLKKIQRWEKITISPLFNTVNGRMEIALRLKL